MDSGEPSSRRTAQVGVSEGRSPLRLPHGCPEKSPGEAASPGAELKASLPQRWSRDHHCSGSLLGFP